jgi:hypothetical protein
MIVMLIDELERAGYKLMSTEAGNELARLSRGRHVAWSVYEVTTGERECLVHWRTNDDRDHGAPTEYAQDTFTVPGEDALGLALSVGCGGGSRLGVGHVVLVYVDGKLVERVDK